MTEDELQVFVQGTLRYFEQVTRVRPFADAPYVRAGAPVLLDFTGAIEISGNERGCVYFSASREMLVRLLATLGDDQGTEREMSDLVGEIANTISGNARESFGSNFNISVPTVFVGADQGLPEAANGVQQFVIPIRWQDASSNLIIALDH